MTITLHHVALLVDSLERVRDRVAPWGFELGPVQAFPAEGTRELYVGAEGANGRLLLMEALGEGPYRRALRQRGPGLHHVAIAVSDLDAYLASLAGSGWYLLPQSVASLRESRTAWLARPGFPGLVEVFAADELPAPPVSPVVSRLELPGLAAKPGLIEALALPDLVEAPDRAIWLTVQGARLALSTLLA